MKITGDKKFVLNTKKALRLIKKHSFECYDFVMYYLEEIKQNNFSYLYSYEKIIYYVDNKISNNDILLASYILREAYHSYLIQDSLIANKNGQFNCYNGERNSKLCNKFHLDILKELGASKEEINFVLKQINKKQNKEEHTIRIIGDKYFIEKVKSALLLLRERDYLSYKTVIQNIRRVIYFPSRLRTFFDRFQDVPTCCMNSVEYDYSVENMCGALVHEACHNKLYKDALIDGLNPDEECCGYNAEMYCLTREIESMKAVGASEKLIQKYISFYGTDWWNENEKVKLELKH